jgi:hypothetical protein
LLYMPMGPVWIRVGHSSWIKNWLNVMPYVSTKPEMRYIPSEISDIETSISSGWNDLLTSGLLTLVA